MRTGEAANLLRVGTMSFVPNILSFNIISLFLDIVPAAEDTVINTTDKVHAFIEVTF